MARQLRAQGREVALLAIIDTGPAWRPPASFTELLRAAPGCLMNLPRWSAEFVTHVGAFPLRRKLRQRTRSIQQFLLSKLGGTAQPKSAPRYEDMFELDVLTERTRQLLPSHFQALMRYNPGAYEGRLTLFRARTRPLIHTPRHDMGWGEVVKGGVDVEVVAGGHSTMLAEPHVRELAAALRRKLEEIPQSPYPVVRDTTLERGSR
jgi:thioesterase domain-containing protein